MVRDHLNGDILAKNHIFNHLLNHFINNNEVSEKIQNEKCFGKTKKHIEKLSNIVL